MLYGIEEEAMFIRHAQVVALNMLSIEGLCAIIEPSPELLRASLEVAWAERDKPPAPKPAPRERYVTLDDLLR